MNPFLLYLEYMVKLGDAIDKSPYGPYWRAYWRMMGDPVRDFWNDNAREVDENHANNK